MVEIITVTDWQLEINRQATQTAYDNSVEDCFCAYCRNFRKAYHSLHPELIDLMNRLGIDPQKPSNITEYVINKDGTHLYCAMYNVVGKILSPLNFEESNLDSGKMLFRDFTEGTTIFFTSDVNFPGNFPKPLIQFEFFSNLPWVLSEDT